MIWKLDLKFSTLIICIFRINCELFGDNNLSQEENKLVSSNDSREANSASLVNDVLQFREEADTGGHKDHEKTKYVHLWPKGRIPVNTNTSFVKQVKLYPYLVKNIDKVEKILFNKTGCIRLVEKEDSDKDFIEFTDVKRTSSHNHFPTRRLWGLQVNLDRSDRNLWELFYARSIAYIVNKQNRGSYLSNGCYVGTIGNSVLFIENYPLIPTLLFKRNEEKTTLKIGSKGEDVKEIQRALGLPPDGVFGQNTAVHVFKFQKSNGLDADGIVGSKTWAMIQAVVNGISTKRTLKQDMVHVGGDVEEVQRAVGANPDGVFGRTTEARVKEYQRIHGLSPNGVVCEETWAMIRGTAVPCSVLGVGHVVPLAHVEKYANQEVGEGKFKGSCLPGVQYIFETYGLSLGLVRTWKKGIRVKGNNVTEGTAVAQNLKMKGIIHQVQLQYSSEKHLMVWKFGISVMVCYGVNELLNSMTICQDIKMETVIMLSNNRSI